MSLINQIAQVSYSPDVGRYLVAARDIKPLELVIWDAADAMGAAGVAAPKMSPKEKPVDGAAGEGATAGVAEVGDACPSQL